MTWPTIYGERVELNIETRLYDVKTESLIWAGELQLSNPKTTGEAIGQMGMYFEHGVAVDGVTHVPLIVHWPGEIQPNSTSPVIVTGTDYYPTLLDMLNLPALPDQHIDGRSFVPALKAEDYDRGPIYWHFPHYSNHGMQSPGGAVRRGKYKLLEYFENNTVQLFNLRTDIGEQEDLARIVAAVQARQDADKYAYLADLEEVAE